MPKYYSPNDQTLMVSSGPTEDGKFNFFTIEASQWWSLFVFAVSCLGTIFIVFAIDALLEYFKILNWRKNYEDFGMVVVGVLMVLLYLELGRFWYIFYRTEVSIKHDGRIVRSTRVLGSTLNTRTFEKDQYGFLFERNYEEEYLETGRCEWEAYRISIVDKTGRRFPLFVVREDDGIEEFKEKFSSFTGFLPEI